MQDIASIRNVSDLINEEKEKNAKQKEELLNFKQHLTTLIDQKLVLIAKRQKEYYEYLDTLNTNIVCIENEAIQKLMITPECDFIFWGVVYNKLFSSNADIQRKFQNDMKGVEDKVQQINIVLEKPVDLLHQIQLEKTNKDLTEQIFQMQTTNNQLQTSKSKISKTNWQLTEEINLIQTENYQLTQQISQMKTTNNQQNEKIPEMSKTNNQLTQQISQIKTTIYQLPDKLSQMQKTYDLLNSNISQAQKLNNQLTGQKSQMQTKNNQISELLSQMKTSNTQSTRQLPTDNISKLQTIHNQLTDYISQIQTINNQISGQISSLLATKNQMTEQISQILKSYYQLYNDLYPVPSFNPFSPFQSPKIFEEKPYIEKKNSQQGNFAYQNNPFGFPLPNKFK